jgi:hypothetical protein
VRRSGRAGMVRDGREKRQSQSGETAGSVVRSGRVNREERQGQEGGRGAREVKKNHCDER